MGESPHLLGWWGALWWVGWEAKVAAAGLGSPWGREARTFCPAEELSCRSSSTVALVCCHRAFGQRATCPALPEAPGERTEARASQCSHLGLPHPLLPLACFGERGWREEVCPHPHSPPHQGVCQHSVFTRRPGPVALNTDIEQDKLRGQQGLVRLVWGHFPRLGPETPPATP